MAKKVTKKKAPARSKATAKKKTTRKKAAKKKTTKKKAAKKTSPRRSRVARHKPSDDVVVDDVTGVASVAPSKTRARNDDTDDGIERDEAWQDWYDLYIDGLAQEGSHENAAKVSGVSVRTAQRHRKKHELFAAACNDAWEEVVDSLEASAMKRAIQGTLEPIMYRKERVGAKRSYETSLTIFMLKQNRREKYGQDGPVDERDARERAREFRQALTEMDDTIPDSPEAEED
jgi:hypothetical protein